jgi:hypothetical protein
MTVTGRLNRPRAISRFPEVPHMAQKKTTKKKVKIDDLSGKGRKVRRVSAENAERVKGGGGGDPGGTGGGGSGMARTKGPIY